MALAGPRRGVSILSNFFLNIWQKQSFALPPARNPGSSTVSGRKNFISTFLVSVTLMPVEPHFGTLLKKMYFGCWMFTGNASESFTSFTPGLFTLTELTLRVPFSVWTTTMWSCVDLLLALASCPWNLWWESWKNSTRVKWKSLWYLCCDKIWNKNCERVRR